MYKVVSSFRLESLEELVSDLIKGGYWPAGGICMVKIGDETEFYQALVKAQTTERKP